MSNEIEKKVAHVNGKTIVLPLFDPEHITLGLRRKTRNLTDEKAQEEIFWSILESELTDEELEVWDNLTPGELEEAMKQVDEDPLKK